MTSYKDWRCEGCAVFVCPEECFNSHPGSMIALEKLLRAKAIKGHVVK